MVSGFEIKRWRSHFNPVPATPTDGKDQGHRGNYSMRDMNPDLMESLAV
jgi:hypothetical protein